VLFLALVSEGSSLCRLAGPALKPAPRLTERRWFGLERSRLRLTEVFRTPPGAASSAPPSFGRAKSKSFRLPFPLAESQLSRDIGYGNKGHQD
jgi:hypothetical protein